MLVTNAVSTINTAFYGQKINNFVIILLWFITNKQNKTNIYNKLKHRLNHVLKGKLKEGYNI